MPVQQRRFIARPGRAQLVAWSFPLLLLASGCAQQQNAETQTPEQASAERNNEIALLRRDNASLRTQVQNLDERVRMLEASGGGYASARGGSASSSVGYESYGAEPGPNDWQGDSAEPRQLPVVRITPNERSVSHQDPAATPSAVHGGPSPRLRESVSLTAGPQGGSPDSELAGQYVVDARGGVDFDESDPNWNQPVPDEGNEPASYRLVGSRLVQATKRRPVTAPSKSSKSTDSRVVKEYKAAMTVYRDGRYAEAEQAFASIVSSHPGHDYADNALYWQGEASYDQAHYADALAAFTRVVEHYGGGNKAPDALLKIGLCYARLGDQANARDVLTQLVAAYPRADASKIAKRKLADLGD